MPMRTWSGDQLDAIRNLMVNVSKLDEKKKELAGLIGDSFKAVAEDLSAGDDKVKASFLRKIYAAWKANAGDDPEGEEVMAVLELLSRRRGKVAVADDVDDSDGDDK